MQDFGHYGAIDRRCRRSLKEMTDKGIVPIGIGLTIPSPFMVELAAVSGFDFVWIDMEHNIFNPESVADMIRAADSAGMAATARIAQMDLILPLLDFGMVGFTIPHVRTAAQAREIVETIKYAPAGQRGYSVNGRAMRFGTMPFADYYEEVRGEVTVTVLIEDEEGIANCEEILAVPGIDYLTLGPGDISQSLGHIGELDHPDCVAARKKVLAAADKMGIKHVDTGAPAVIAQDRAVLLDGLIKCVEDFKAK